MNTTLVEAVVKSLLSAALSPTTVVIGYDQSVGPQAAQVSVMASAEPMARNAAGTPVAWTVMVRMYAVTQKDEDANGATRNNLRGLIASWAASVAIATLNVTGFACVGKPALSQEENIQYAEEFIGAATRMDLVYGPAA